MLHFPWMLRGAPVQTFVLFVTIAAGFLAGSAILWTLVYFDGLIMLLVLLWFMVQHRRAASGSGAPSPVVCLSQFAPGGAGVPPATASARHPDVA